MNVFLLGVGFLTLVLIAFLVLSGSLSKFKNSREKFLVFSAFFLISIFSISAYYFWGGSGKLLNYYQEKNSAPLIAQWRQQFSNVDAVIQRMENHLAQDPNSVQGWYLLGRLYFSEQNYEKAAQSFAKAAMLKPKDPLILIQEAAALLYLKDYAQYSPKILKLLEEVIQKDAKNSAAYNLLGVLAFREKKYQLAIHYWQITLENLPPNGVEYRSLVEAINKAEQLRKI